jgi:hypothetical protein
MNLKCENCGILNGNQDIIKQFQKSSGLNMFLCKSCAHKHAQICEDCRNHNLSVQNTPVLELDLNTDFNSADVLRDHESVRQVRVTTLLFLCTYCIG